MLKCTYGHVPNSVPHGAMGTPSRLRTSFNEIVIQWQINTYLLQITLSPKNIKQTCFIPLNENKKPWHRHLRPKLAPLLVGLEAACLAYEQLALQKSSLACFRATLLLRICCLKPFANHIRYRTFDFLCSENMVAALVDKCMLKRRLHSNTTFPMPCSSFLNASLLRPLRLRGFEGTLFDKVLSSHDGVVASSGLSLWIDSILSNDAWCLACFGNRCSSFVALAPLFQGGASTTTGRVTSHVRLSRLVIVWLSLQRSCTSCVGCVALRRVKNNRWIHACHTVQQCPAIKMPASKNNHL